MVLLCRICPVATYLGANLIFCWQNYIYVILRMQMTVEETNE